jgi:UDP-N-acetylmuramoyl-L-alanyl-D-glutamate--2,6-diaminopimelate ligase
VSSPDTPPPRLTGIADDSRQVQPGFLFCAVEGTVDDGHRYLADAVRRGAAAALVTRRGEQPIPQVIVEASRPAVAVAAAEWYGRPGDALELVGVTGTNGKSTTVALIRHLLNAEGRVASIGTLGAFDGGGSALYREHLTTPGTVEIHATLAELKHGGATTVILEVSSHALDQSRVHGLAFRAGVFTNLTHDHLDYHATFDDYLAAKLRLADQVQPEGVFAVNIEEPAWRRLGELPAHRVLTFGRSHSATVRASDVALHSDGTDFVLHVGDSAQAIRLPLIGEFNVSNALAAAATALGLGHDVGEIVGRLPGVPQVAGRMERLDDRFVILRDYAHTPDALERAMQALRPITQGRLIVLFGCGGDRDRRKRAVMGEAAARDADIAIVTSDNPRTEDPERIIADIEVGMEGHSYHRIVDRREAILRAVELMDEHDCLLLAGKGHETYQVIGTERFPFDEREIAQEAIAGLHAK